jgi:hypothetical protein
LKCDNEKCRGVAQPGSAPALGPDEPVAMPIASTRCNSKAMNEMQRFYLAHLFFRRSDCSEN